MIRVVAGAAVAVALGVAATALHAVIGWAVLACALATAAAIGFVWAVAWGDRRKTQAQAAATAARWAVADADLSQTAPALSPETVAALSQTPRPAIVGEVVS